MTSPARIALTLALAAPLGLAAGGCTQLRAHQGYIVDQTLVDSVAVGIDNRTSVEKTLGRPTFANQFGAPADGSSAGAILTTEQATDWYYLSRNTRQLAFAEPRPTEQTLLHVRFDAAGNVASVSRTGIETVSRISPNGDSTPTLGRERSFFEDIFGNIGAVGAAGVGSEGPGGGG